MLERSVEQSLGRKVRKAGGRYYKLGQDGLPDRIIVLPPDGRTVFVELKQEKGRLRLRQKVRADELRAVGADVRAIHGTREANALVQELFPALGGDEDGAVPVSESGCEMDS